MTTFKCICELLPDGLSFFQGKVQIFETTFFYKDSDGVSAHSGDSSLIFTKVKTLCTNFSLQNTLGAGSTHWWEGSTHCWAGSTHCWAGWNHCWAGSTHWWAGSTHLWAGSTHWWAGSTHLWAGSTHWWTGSTHLWAGSAHWWAGSLIGGQSQLIGGQDLSLVGRVSSLVGRISHWWSGSLIGGQGQLIVGQGKSLLGRINTLVGRVNSWKYWDYWICPMLFVKVFPWIIPPTPRLQKQELILNVFISCLDPWLLGQILRNLSMVTYREVWKKILEK